MQTPEIFQGDNPRRLIQGAFFGAVATVVGGFYLGGWTLGSTTQKQVSAAEQASVVRVLAPICADSSRTRPTPAPTLRRSTRRTRGSARHDRQGRMGHLPRLGAGPQVADACAKLLSQVK